MNDFLQAENYARFVIRLSSMIANLADSTVLMHLFTAIIFCFIAKAFILLTKL